MDNMLTKLGTNKGLERSRVWIEGKRLSNAGFVRGALYMRETTPDYIRLTIANPAETDERLFKVSGKSDHPIIDITGKKIAEQFGDCSHVQVWFEQDRITIASP